MLECRLLQCVTNFSSSSLPCDHHTSSSKNYIYEEAAQLANPRLNASTWWEVARRRSGFDNRNGESEIPPLRSSNEEFANTGKKKAELLNEVYINQNVTVSPCSFPCGPTNINELFKLSCVTTGEVDRVVRNLPSKISAGQDGISYRLLKEAGRGLIDPLTNLFNRSVTLGQVPDEWKSPIVSPVFKGG